MGSNPTTPGTGRVAGKGAGMSKSRMEAFSDGVFAILITIMVLELRPPEGTTSRRSRR